MLTKITTASLWGLETDLVTVEVDLHPGLPALNVVGLADMTIKEAKERIRAAVLNSGFVFPAKRITVNLSPAGKRKEGSHFDLPIALGILLWEAQERHETNINVGAVQECGVIGELSLDGRVRAVRGALPLALGMRERGIKKMILPADNTAEVSMIKDIELYPAESLEQAFYGYLNLDLWEPFKQQEISEPDADVFYHPDYSEVVGQENVKRAITTAVAGNHGILLMGSPGVGKTMLAKRIPTIMPDMDYEETLEVSKIYSVAGRLSSQVPVIKTRPFISPHHTVTKAALIGGGQRPRPGEISLAHRGVLFLDELGEFDSRLLNYLRQPIEDGFINLIRSDRSAEFPCRFMLVAASNPCKCGYLGDPTHVCTCTAGQIESYRSKFSGPLLDRIDLHIATNAVNVEHLEAGEKIQSSADMKKIVKKARDAQQKRQGEQLNGQLNARGVEDHCFLGREEKAFLKEAYEKLAFSMRTYKKIIKIGRTIADMEGSDVIKTVHLAEAVQYRSLTDLDRKAVYGDQKSIYK